MSGIIDFLRKSPEELQAEDAAINLGTRKLGNAFLSMTPSLLAPDRALPGAAGYIPLTGLGEVAAGTVGAGLEAASTLGNAGLEKLGYSTRLPHAPEWMTAAGQHFANTQDTIQDFIAAHTPLEKPDQNSETDRILNIVGSTLGGAVPFVPAGVARAVTNLAPRGLKTAAGFVLPSTERLPANVPIATALAGLGGVGEKLTGPGDITPTDGGGGGQTKSSGDMGLSDFLQPTKPSAAPTGNGDMGLSDALNGGNTPPGPTFSDTGYSSMTVGQAAVTLAGAVIAIAGGKYLHGTSRVINDVGRDLRFNDPAYAAKAADYNNAVIMRGGSEISDGLNTPVPPPLPEQGKVRQFSNSVNQNLFDSNAQMMDAIKMSADPSVAQQLAHQYGMSHNDMAWKTRMSEFLETGRDPQSGITVPRPAKLYRDFTSLEDSDPARYKILDDALHARDEMDNRRDNATQFGRANAGSIPTPEDIRHNFKNQSNEELDTIIQRAVTDPVLNDMMERYHAVPRGLIDIGAAHGFFTPAEANDLKTTHPYHVAEVGPTGETRHPMQRRDKTIATGVDQVNTRAINSLAQHVEELYHQYHLNDMNRSLRQSQMDTQRAYPQSAQFMYDVPAPSNDSSTFYTGGQFREPVVTIRHSDGPTFTRVDHPDYYNGMTGDSLRKREIASELVTIPRRMYQYMTTGVGSLVSGRIAPLANVGYTALTMGVNAPKRTYGGLLDRTLQRNAPAGVANVLSPVARGIDTVTTTPVGIGYSYLRGIGDRWMWRAAKAIEPGQDNWINNTLRAYHGDAYVNTWQDAIRNAYEATKTAQFAERGIGGQGVPVKVDLPTLQIESNKQASLVAARLVPQLVKTDSGPWNNVRPVLISANRIVQDAMSHISDAGHEYYARLNWDNPNLSSEGLAYETRNLTGDPGVHGASKVVRNITNVLPYANVSMQGVARVGRSFGDRPVGAPMALATGVGTLALLEILTHMRSQQHLDYYQNELSARERAANIVLATSGDPRRPTMIPVPQELRFAKAFMTEILGKAVNVVALQHDPDLFKNVWNGLVDFFGSHISNAGVSSMVHGAVDAADFINLPQYAGHIDWTGVIYGKHIVDAYRPPVSGQPLNLPNQVPDGPLDDKEGKVLSSIMKAVFGLAGTMFDYTANGLRYAEQTGSWVDALGMSGHDWMQGMRDKNPQFGFVWEPQVRLSTQSPIEEQVSRKMYALDKIEGSRSDPRTEGMTSGSRYAQPVPTSNTTKVPTDPAMLALWNIAEAYKTRMADRKDEITQLKRQMLAVDQEGMDPPTKRAWMNKQTRMVADKYRLIGDMVADMEYAMSTNVGRSVHIEDVDWHKGVEQFNN